MILNWISFAAGALVALLLGFAAHTIDVSMIKSSDAKALKDQSINLTAQCHSAGQITTGVSNDYEKALNDLTLQRATADSVRQGAASTIAVLPTTVAGGHNASTSTDQLVHTRTISIKRFNSIAAEGEKYRLQLLACQSLVSKTWAANGQ